MFDKMDVISNSHPESMFAALDEIRLPLSAPR